MSQCRNFFKKGVHMANKKAKFLTMKSQVRMISIKCYEEQLPYGWEETVKRIKKISKDKWIVIAIKHDKDSVTDEVWEPPLEKAHFHIIVKFVNGDHPRVKNILEALDVVYRPIEDEVLWKNHGVEAIEDWVNMVTYLPHLTDDAKKDGKYEYGLEELVSNLTIEEIENIMGSYVHKVKDTDLKTLDREAFEKGYSLYDFDDWYKDFDFEIKRKSDMKVIRESYQFGVQKRIEEHEEIIRLCIFIQGEKNQGKTYATRKALEGKKYLVTSPGTGKFDELKATTQAIIIDDDVCPNLLNMTDNYMCKAYRRNKDNPAWTGDYFVVTSNLSFDEWLKESNITKESHIDAMHTRFYVCFVRNKKLVCKGKCTRGTMEVQEKRDRMYREFKKKFEESISQYNPQMYSTDLFDVNTSEECVYLLEDAIERLQNKNKVLRETYGYSKQMEYNNRVIAQYMEMKEDLEKEVMMELQWEMYRDEFMEDLEKMMYI